MGAQNGKDLLIKLDLDGAGQFETIAGLRATRISFNAESVDVTSLEYAGSHNGEATFELSLASAGALTFTAA